MPIQIINKSKEIKVSKAVVKKIIIQIAQYLNLELGNLDILFCDNLFIQQLNEKYFNNNVATDVISFPLHSSLMPVTGQIVISLEKARENAIKFKNHLKDEILLYLIHAFLHLIGYEDAPKQRKSIMQKKEKELIMYINKNDKDHKGLLL